MLKRIGWAGLIGGVISGGFLFLMMVAFRGVPLEDNQFGRCSAMPRCWWR